MATKLIQLGGLALLVGCSPAPVVAPVRDVILPAANDVALAVAKTAGEILPPTPPGGEARPPQATPAEQATIKFVARWEVGSERLYTRKYQHPICPGGYSGPTVGIGHDLGTHTAAEIRSAWAEHPDVDVMVTASGQTGRTRCKEWVTASAAKVTVTYAQALETFRLRDWPRYMAMAAHAYTDGWMGLSGWHQGGLGSNGYNRGFSFLGGRRKEMRAIRDTCVPSNDAYCTGAQLRKSCRVWEGTRIYRGLCNRRKGEADLVETGT